MLFFLDNLLLCETIITGLREIINFRRIDFLLIYEYNTSILHAIDRLAKPNN